MTASLEPLFRSVYQKTKGFILNYPIGRPMKLGDVFTVSNTEMSVIESIYNDSFGLELDPFKADFYELQDPYDPTETTIKTIRPKLSNWRVSSYASSTYQAEDGQHSLIYKFKRGDYFFTASDVNHLLLHDFTAYNKRILRNLLQRHLSLSHFYVVTEIALIKDFSCGVCSQDKGLLKFRVEDFYNGTLTELLNASISLNVTSVSGMTPLQFKAMGGTIAFKAKKLRLTDKAREHFLHQLFNSDDENLLNNLTDTQDVRILALLPDIEINAANVSDFFEWTDVTIDDIAHIL